jgi:hypothetical protein
MFKTNIIGEYVQYNGEHISSEKYKERLRDLLLRGVDDTEQRKNNLLASIKKAPLPKVGTKQWVYNSNILQAEVHLLVEKNLPLLTHFLDELYTVLRMLAADPIVAGSGAYEEKPIELSSAEIGERIADKLANPDAAYTAWCKFGTHEHIIQALPYPPADSDAVWRERENRILENTRFRYCMSRDEVKNAIRERRNQLTTRGLPTARTTSDDDE